MNRWGRLTLGLMVAFSLVFGSISRSEEAVLENVPRYYWTHGCSPTAGMMLLGYWDANGYPYLIPRDNRQMERAHLGSHCQR